MIQPLDADVIIFIKSVVFEQGALSTRQMKLLLEHHVKDAFKGNVPPRANKRFCPSNKDVRNHIALALKQQRNSTVDQVRSIILTSKVLS